MVRDPDGTVVTFYSYKGGTGRTMAVANVAWILAANGRRVLAVDWDLDSPGLHRFYQLLPPPPGGDLSLHDRLKILENNITLALVLEYHEIFRLAALLCAVAAVIAGLTLGRRYAVQQAE